jgi:hypothetical protein
LNSNVVGTSGRTGRWTGEEDIKLKAAKRAHGDTNGDKSWDEIAVLVPGRTSHQCCGRWQRLRKKREGINKELDTDGFDEQLSDTDDDGPE